MRVHDADNLKNLTEAGRCEICSHFCRQRCAHHVCTKGAGGGDNILNLVSVGFGDFVCQCHDKIHWGVIPREECERIIADREGIPLPWVKEIQWLISRLPKNPSDAEIQAELDGRPAKFAALVRREIGA